MSVEKIAAVLHHSRSAGTDRLVLIGIANHEGDGGAYPSVATLAKYANCSERTVQRSIKALVELGELRVKVQGGGDEDWRKDRRPNRYRVLVTCPDTCDRTFNHRDLSGVTPMTPRDASGVTSEADGVTPMTPPRGDTAMSPEPSIDNRPLEPTPLTPPGALVLVQTEALPSVAACGDGFEQFWRAYPRKTAKNDALKAWKQTAKSRPPIEALLRAVAVYLETDEVVRGYIQYPATWLRAGRWDDEPAPRRSTGDQDVWVRAAQNMGIV